MKELFTITPNKRAEVAQEIEFSDHDNGNRKEFKVLFKVYEHRVDGNDTVRPYTVIVTRRNLIAAGLATLEDSKKLALEYAIKVLKQRFLYSEPEENAAICTAKKIELVNLSHQ